MLALDPAQTFAARLPDDEEAVFRFRYLTGREYLGALELSRRREDAELFDQEVIRAVYEALRMNLVGWMGVKQVRHGTPVVDIPYDPSHLEDVTTSTEAWVLFYQSIAQSKASDAEKNVSESPSGSSTEQSVEGAAGPPGASTE